MQNFSHVDTWVFDLDNTLYDAESHVFVEITRKATEFFRQSLKVSEAEARNLRDTYYHKYGTSWRGLMIEHGIRPEAAIDYMHDIDIAPVLPCTITQDYLNKLQGRKIIFTNSPRFFAEKMTKHLGLDSHFESIYTLEDAKYCPKPHIDSFNGFIAHYGIDPKKSCMFEDAAGNLATAHGLGMTTVWFHGDNPATDHDFVHHKMPRLADWLLATLPK